jgi:hypothetical protein
VPPRFGLAAAPEVPFDGALRVALDRLEPEDEDFLARVAPDLRAPPVLALRELLDLPPLDLRAPPLRDDDEPLLTLALPSTVHLPDMTRCAASATASAMSEPSLVALAMTLLAA